MLTIWTGKIKHSTVGSSFRVTFVVAPNEVEYLNKLYDCFNSMNMKSFPITADRKTEPQTKCKTCKWGDVADEHCEICGIAGIDNYEPQEREGE